MSTALNDRDAILQAASVRIINPKNADILMKAEPSLFHVNAAGAVDVAATTITATLIGLEGDVTFAVDGATLTSVTGKTAVVRYVDMQGPAAIVTARIVAGGEPFTQSCIIGVVRDGAPGNGTPGARGAGQYFAGGSAWSDGTANAATPGDNVVSDVVTISNGGTFAMTKRWDGAAWNAIGAVFDGSLFVTGSINGAALKVGTVEIRKPDGTLILGAGGTLAAEAAAPGTKNSEIVVGGRNLFPDGDFERGVHTLQGTVSAYITNREGAISGTKSLFMDGTVADMYAWLVTRANVTPGKEYRISFYSKSATVGLIIGSSSYIRTWNSSGAVDYVLLPMSGMGSGAWERQVVAWTCPPGITQIEPRFGITTNGAYSWLAIDCLQIEEGNSATQWTPAIEDIAADAQAKAVAQGNAAYGAAVNTAAADATGKANAAQAAAIAAANAALAVKLNKGGDVLGGIISVDTVNAPAGFRAGNLTWNAAGDYTGGYGTAMTPKGLIGYDIYGRRTFMINGQNGNVQLYGDLMGGSYTGADWPASGYGGFFLGHAGLFLGNARDGKFVRVGADGNMYMPGFAHENGQLTLDQPIIINPRLNVKSASIASTGGTYFTSSRNNPSAYMGSHRMDVTGLTPVRYAWSFTSSIPSSTFSPSMANGQNPTSLSAFVNGVVGQAFDVYLTCTAFDAGGLSVSASTTITLEIT
jgi:hypothetical protein